MSINIDIIHNNNNNKNKDKNKNKHQTNNKKKNKNNNNNMFDLCDEDHHHAAEGGNLVVSRAQGVTCSHPLQFASQSWLREDADRRSVRKSSNRSLWAIASLLGAGCSGNRVALSLRGLG